MRTISLHRGDITTDTDAGAIVNAANSSLLGGAGVDGAIELAAEHGAACVAFPAISLGVDAYAAYAAALDA